MKQKTLSQVFDQNINSEMLLWSGNDAIFGITICFHGRKMRIWLQLLQKRFAEKISTILLKSIHIFCSHVGLYHSEKNRCMTRHFLCLAQFHTTHIAAKPNGIWSSNSSLCGTSSISSHQPRRARNWKKNEISAWSCNIIRLFLLLLTYCTSGLHLIFTLKNALLAWYQLHYYLHLKNFSHSRESRQFNQDSIQSFILYLGINMKDWVYWVLVSELKLRDFRFESCLGTGLKI